MPKPPQSTPPHPRSVHPEDCTNPLCVFYPSATLRTSISPSSVPSSLDYADLLSSLPRIQSHMSMHSGLKPCISFPLCGMMHPGLSVFFVIMIIMLLNMVARLISNKRKFGHITPVFKDQLRWLPVGQRINFKIAVLVHNSRHVQGPTYLSHTRIYNYDGNLFKPDISIHTTPHIHLIINLFYFYILLIILLH